MSLVFVQNEMKGETGSHGAKGEKGEPGGGYYDPRYGGSGPAGEPGPPVSHTYVSSCREL